MSKKCVSFLSVFTVILTSIVFLTSCEQKTEIPAADPAYLAEIKGWHEKRVQSLKSENGWLTLAGLFWLEEGENTFGSDENNAIIFPGNNIPASIGSFLLEEGKVTMKILKNVNVVANNERVSTLKMNDDMSESPTIAMLESLNWHVIKRGDKYGIRLKDKKNKHLLEFKGIDRFQVNPAYKVKAEFKPYSPGKSIIIPNVLGQENEEKSPGYLAFKLNGKEFTLDTISGSETSPFFIIFSDNTNGQSTYGAGRFLSVERPGVDGFTFIDFNKSYCPPCAFTKFATCPLPPVQNYLDTEVMAGEKKPDKSAH